MRAATGFADGGVPPVGHGLPVIVDESLLRHRRVWAAAGDPQSVFCVDPHKLVDCLHAKVAELAEHGIEPEKPPYHPGDRDDLPLIAFVPDPDGYRIELIEGGEFRTPQDPDE